MDEQMREWAHLFIAKILATIHVFFPIIYYFSKFKVQSLIFKLWIFRSLNLIFKVWISRHPILTWFDSQPKSVPNWSTLNRIGTKVNWWPKLLVQLIYFASNICQPLAFFYNYVPMEYVMLKYIFFLQNKKIRENMWNVNISVYLN